MSTGFHIGKAKISTALLHDLLRLPADVSIEGIEQGYANLRDGCFVVYVSGAGVPENTGAVGECPLLAMSYRKEAGKTTFSGFERIK